MMRHDARANQNADAFRWATIRLTPDSGLGFFGFSLLLMSVSFLGTTVGNVFLHRQVVLTVLFWTGKGGLMAF